MGDLHKLAKHTGLFFSIFVHSSSLLASRDATSINEIVAAGNY